MNNDLVSRLLDGLVAPEGAFNDDPPIWAQDPFNGDTAEKCGRCHAWRSVVRPGKTQCDYCCDNNNYSLHIEAATALTEARAEIERLRSCLASSETQYQARGQEVLNEMHRADTAESELSTLRARVREVVGPFAADPHGLTDDEMWTVYTMVGEVRAARQLMEEVK